MVNKPGASPGRGAKTNSLARTLLLAIFALSGFAGLIYQSIWTHYLGRSWAMRPMRRRWCCRCSWAAWRWAHGGFALWHAGRNLIKAYALAEAVIGLRHRLSPAVRKFCPPSNRMPNPGCPLIILIVRIADVFRAKVTNKPSKPRVGLAHCIARRSAHRGAAFSYVPGCNPVPTCRQQSTFALLQALGATQRTADVSKPAESLGDDDPVIWVDPAAFDQSAITAAQIKIFRKPAVCATRGRADQRKRRADA